MGRALVVVRGKFDRDRASEWAQKAPVGTRIEFKASKRTLPQNDRLWAMLTDVATQVDWYGEKYSPNDWKDMFTASFRKQRTVPGIDGGFVVLGLRTSDMSKGELSDLLEIIAAFGAEHNVTFHDQAT